MMFYRLGDEDEEEGGVEIPPISCTQKALIVDCFKIKSSYCFTFSFQYLAA